MKSYGLCLALQLRLKLLLPHPSCYSQADPLFHHLSFLHRQRLSSGLAPTTIDLARLHFLSRTWHTGPPSENPALGWVPSPNDLIPCSALSSVGPRAPWTSALGGAGARGGVVCGEQTNARVCRAELNSKGPAVAFFPSPLFADCPCWAQGQTDSPCPSSLSRARHKTWSCLQLHVSQPPALGFGARRALAAPLQLLPGAALCVCVGGGMHFGVGRQLSFHSLHLLPLSLGS